MFLSSLAGQGVLPLWKVFFFCYLGNFFSDCVWFAFGRTRLIQRIFLSRYFSRSYEKMNDVLKTFDSRELFVFILVKFIYGIRVITIVYFGGRRYNPSRFLAYNSIAILVITTAVTVSGWGTGRGIGLFMDIFGSIRTAFTSLVAIALLIHVVRKLAGRLAAKASI
jgi:membrane protein DedA with SNARE-associated domain